MRAFRAWLIRVAGACRVRRRDDEFEAEIASHLELHVEDNLRSGMTPEQARRAALLRFGNLQLAREDYRARRGIPALETLIRDVRYGTRLLRRDPGFTAAVTLSLALGIGANCAVFSITDALLLKPLPVREPDRLVHLLPGGGRTSWSYPLWDQLRARADRFEGIAAFSTRDLNLARSGPADLADGLLVSAGFFDLLGVPPVLGRTFQTADDTSGSGPDGPVAVISHGFWQRRFDGAPDVVGTSLSVERIPFTIIGVAPPAFTGPIVGRTFDVAIPVGASPLILDRNRLHERTWWWLTIMARLRPGRTVQDARAFLTVIQPDLREATRPTNLRPQDAALYLKDPIEAHPAPAGPSQLRRAYRQPLLTVMVVVALILLIACVNVANLLLARADARRHEISVRLALGASRVRLVRQFFIESLLLSTMAAVPGLLAAGWASHLLVGQFSISGRPVVLDLPLDWRLLGFTAALAVMVAVLFGTAPALAATTVNTLGVRQRIAAGTNGWGAGGALVAAQIALCLILLVAAGLFVRTFAALAGRPRGFDSAHVLLTEIDLRRSTHPPAERLLLYERVLDSVHALPGISAAALSVVTPVSDNEWSTLIENPPGVSLPESERVVMQNLVSPGWFEVYGIPLVAGRDFIRSDISATSNAVIINETMARRYFAGENPVGRAIQEVGSPADPAAPLTIIGLVADSIYLSLREEPSPTLYRPITPGPLVSLSVRSARGSPAQLAPLLSSALTGVDRDLTLTMRALGRISMRRSHASGSSRRCRAPSERWRCCSRLSVFTGWSRTPSAPAALRSESAWPWARARPPSSCCSSGASR